MSAEEMKRKARAFVLIETKPGKEKEVMEKLLKYEEVKEVHIYSGEMDLIAVLETEREMLVPSSKKVADLVIDKIQSIKEIQDTETIIPTYSKTKWLERV
ncbi:MAG: Lrp/AsnC ligand binding domain-containing protein [Candidatus Bathyarchaeota archaeon]|nr:Lrp/AsnC ligand binding domain-containing protein [Candidatus Bathyarchaeota archaeon]MDH5733887.1 Lrp/AsnC ligand binding domain-containing protein [Candidatus Bathyarchaeota archaeon]